MIEVSHLVKKYGSHDAVNDPSFRVENMYRKGRVIRCCEKEKDFGKGNF